MTERHWLHNAQRLGPWLLVLVSAAIAVAAYLQALDYPFVYDDRVYLTDNPELAGLHFADLWRLLIQPYNPAFEFLPLRDLSYWIELRLFGLTPSAFRLDNILLYLLCLPLIYATTLKLWRYFRPADGDDAPWAAAAITALFALHPALVESVVWISGRKYILPDLFSVLALWFAIRASQAEKFSAWHGIAAVAAFAAVMLSKSSYVAVAALISLLWLVSWHDIPAQRRPLSRLLWPLSILALAIFLLRIFIDINQGYDRIPFYRGVEAIYRSLAALGWLARLAVSPEPHHLFYPVFEDPGLPAMIALGGAVLLAAGWGAVALLRKRSLEGFALVAFLLLCAPYLQLIPHAPPALVSDRYVALAVWPAMLLLVALAWRLRPAPRAMLLLVIALWCGFQTMERTRDWRSFEALLDSDLRDRPGYYIPAMYRIIAVQLPQQRFREASETARSITVPDSRDMMMELVNAHYAVNVTAPSSGKPEEAMALLRELGLQRTQPPVQANWNPSMRFIWQRRRHILVIEWATLARLFPDNAFVRYNAGLWMLEFHEYKGAATNMRMALESQRLPQAVRATAYAGLGAALINSGHIAEAEAPLRAALEQPKPDPRAYCMLADVYKLTNRNDAAIQAGTNCLNLVAGKK